MYAPPAYRADDPRAIVRRYPFAQLVTNGELGLAATAVPIVFASDGPDEQRMIGHMARANPHAESLADGVRALAIFAGPHCYVSASWYRDRPTVPTWNYVAAQVHGTLSPIDDETEQLVLMERLASLVDPDWTLSDAPRGRVAKLLPHIRSFVIHISHIDGVTKLSQTHPESDRRRVVEALERRDHDHDRQIVAWMNSVNSAVQP